ncbi:MAG: hypothetical protein MJY71_01450 [Bacteroidaceae bacterium]|nr:hypothetical protein [Bacteroidaceae bacterium]
MITVNCLKKFHNLWKYFTIGKKRASFWGKGVLAQISERLRSELPGLRGFGESHLKNMLVKLLPPKEELMKLIEDQEN